MSAIARRVVRGHPVGADHTGGAGNRDHGQPRTAAVRSRPGLVPATTSASARADSVGTSAGTDLGQDGVGRGGGADDPAGVTGGGLPSGGGVRRLEHEQPLAPVAQHLLELRQPVQIGEPFQEEADRTDRAVPGSADR